jgi:two-component system sensor histidine kinase TrcS
MIQRRRWWSPRSLRRQLVIGVCGIVTAAVLAVGVSAEISLRNEMIHLLNSQVANSLAAFNYSYAKAKLAVTKPEAGAVAAADLGAFPGQPPGTVIAVVRDGKVGFAAVFTDGEPTAPPAEVVTDLENISWAGADPRTVRLGDLGLHQVGSRDVGGGVRLVSAVSVDDANATFNRNALIVGGLAILALLAAAGGTVILVRKMLKPLRRVAAIAGQVAALPLDAAEYRITARVDQRDTDPATEVGVVGYTLNQMLDNVDSTLTKMAETDRNTKQFLTDASHELRTPLAAILGYAELTRQESDMLPPMTEYALARIEAESQRMSTLVSDLLLLSRLGEGQDLQLEDLDLCDLVADAVNDASVTAPEHHFAADLPDHPVWVRGDRVRLQQLVANLLANARIHTPAETTVTATIRTRGNAGEAVVDVAISDDGPGIPEAIMPNLFGRFVRADKARSREMGSTGLGLAIVASIVEAHGGEVSAESRPGRTVFTVRLPGAPVPMPTI